MQYNRLTTPDKGGTSGQTLLYHSPQIFATLSGTSLCLYGYGRSVEPVRIPIATREYATRSGRAEARPYR